MKGIGRPAVRTLKNEYVGIHETLGSSKAQFRKAMYFATPLSGGVQHISNPAPHPLG
jgi:hypothetical protein